MGLGRGGGNKDDADRMLVDTHQVMHSKDAIPGQGTTAPVSVRGQRQDKGEETYIEIKGPATLDKKSSIPYIKALPSYRQKAQSAIDRQQIPKGQQKRVKEYFDSLSRGK